MGLWLEESLSICDDQYLHISEHLNRHLPVAPLCFSIPSRVSMYTFLAPDFCCNHLRCGLWLDEGGNRVYTWMHTGSSSSSGSQELEEYPSQLSRGMIADPGGKKKSFNQLNSHYYYGATA